MGFDVRSLMLWRGSHEVRLKTALFASLMGTGGTFLFWMAKEPSDLLGVVGPYFDHFVFILGFGFQWAALSFLGLLGFPRFRMWGTDPAAWMALLGFVMVVFLLDAAANRPEAYKDLTAGIIASLMVALVVQDAFKGVRADDERPKGEDGAGEGSVDVEEEE